MIAIEDWRALEAGRQIDMSLAVPDDHQELYILAAHPVAALALRCAAKLTGDTAGDRATIKQELFKGDWTKHGPLIAALREDDDRLNGFVERTVQARHAKENWQQGLEPSVMEMWPAAQLVATVGRIKPGTKERWTAAGGQLFGGRMIALKSSAVWNRFSMFGRPHPPYDIFNHWLDVEDVDHDEAHRLGLL